MEEAQMLIAVAGDPVPRQLSVVEACPEDHQWPAAEVLRAFVAAMLSAEAAKAAAGIQSALAVGSQWAVAAVVSLLGREQQFCRRWPGWHLVAAAVIAQAVEWVVLRQVQVAAREWAAVMEQILKAMQCRR